MERKIITNSRINEQYYSYTHPSGLTVLLYPMEGYSSAYALYATKYGSIDRVFKTDLDKDFITVPDGIAHYLEHKMFEQEDGTDAFELYAETGAAANAYTAFDKTAYLFSCSGNFERSLEILLDFVNAPYFTKENVEKEQGIIGQEIRMYDDNGQWRVFFNLFKCLYHVHPIKIDIAGTVESIAQIDKDLLCQCYNTFYNPANMVIAISGNFDVESAKKVIDEHIRLKEALHIQRGTYDEPDTIAQTEEEIQLEVSLPLFSIGYKMKPLDGIEHLKAALQCEVVNEILVGGGSDLYRSLYDSGLISAGNIYGEVVSGNGFFSVVIGGESRDPKQVYSMIKEEISRLKQEGIPKELYEATKKKLYGKILRAFNNVQAVATNMMESCFSDTDIYDQIELTAQLTYEEVTEKLYDYDSGKSAISIVSPLK